MYLRGSFTPFPLHNIISRQDRLRFKWGGGSWREAILQYGTWGGGVEGDIWLSNTLSLSFSNRFSHVELKKRQNFEEKYDSRGPTSTLKLRFWTFL